MNYLFSFFPSVHRIMYCELLYIKQVIFDEYNLKNNYRNIEFFENPNFILFILIREI